MSNIPAALTAPFHIDDVRTVSKLIIQFKHIADSSGHFTAETNIVRQPIMPDDNIFCRPAAVDAPGIGVSPGFDDNVVIIIANAAILNQGVVT